MELLLLAIRRFIWRHARRIIVFPKTATVVIKHISLPQQRRHGPDENIDIGRLYRSPSAPDLAAAALLATGSGPGASRIPGSETAEALNIEMSPRAFDATFLASDERRCMPAACASSANLG
ncbi:hypothetical protein GR198_19505 [Rhizobium leguminosarum]|uniref:hypothetical protein n=1 Tax=Rhizobium leguminosarum TaxID=384 RepID=UPI0013C24B0D|nr:hypothetical protein [Rhizobium leguminosarum]NEH57913.1 hypothetical protein [Rhizobium leguminosarum]